MHCRSVLRRGWKGSWLENLLRGRARGLLVPVSCGPAGLASRCTSPASTEGVRAENDSGVSRHGIARRPPRHEGEVQLVQNGSSESAGCCQRSFSNRGQPSERSASKGSSPGVAFSLPKYPQLRLRWGRSGYFQCFHFLSCSPCFPTSRHPYPARFMKLANLASLPG
jgi:hypothetical protein